MIPQSQPVSFGVSSAGTIPELQQSKIALLNTLASRHSRRSYEYAIDRFIGRFISEPPDLGKMQIDRSCGQGEALQE